MHSTTEITTTDISSFMKKLGYDWSNEVQIYFKKYPCNCLPMHSPTQTIDKNTATHIYKCLHPDIN